MPAIQIQRDITLDAKLANIHAVLTDFKQWPAWSPWLVQEPECKVTYADDGQSYSWDGKRVGSGTMRLVQSDDTCIEYELTFLKPWKSVAKVLFKLASQGEESTEVTWCMHSKLPFFMFWMKKMMEAFVGMDYERGLTMLKAYIETGTVPSTLNFIGQVDYSGCQYIGLKNQTTLAGIGETMAADFQSLGDYLNSIDESLISGQAFSIYDKYDPVKDDIKYTIGISVTSFPDNLKAPFIKGEIPTTKAYKISHTGSYQYLGNAWSTLYSMERAKEYKCNKKCKPFETYINMPGEVDDSELQTEVYFPIK